MEGVEAEESSQVRQLLISYPMRYFQLYTRTNTLATYKPTPYASMTVSLPLLVQMIFQFGLLLLRCGGGSLIGIAAHPGRMGGKSIHFYCCGAKVQKGFNQINHNQLLQQLCVFLREVRKVKVGEGGEEREEREGREEREEREGELQHLYNWINHFLQQSQSTKQKSIQECSTPKDHPVLTFLISFATSPIPARHLDFPFLITALSSTKLGEQPHLKQYISELEEKLCLSSALKQSPCCLEERVSIVQQFLEFCSNCNALSNVGILQESTKEELSEKSVEDECLGVFFIHMAPPNNITSALLNEIPFVQQSNLLKYQLISNKTRPTRIEIICTVGSEVKMGDWAGIEAFWVRLKHHWMKSVSLFHLSSQMMDVADLTLQRSQLGQLQLRGRVRLEAGVFLRLICLIDKLALFHLLLRATGSKELGVGQQQSGERAYWEGKVQAWMVFLEKRMVRMNR